MKCYYPFLETFNNLRKRSTKRVAMWQEINDKDGNTATEEETRKKQKCKRKKKGWNW